VNCGWSVTFSLSPVIAQITVTSLKRDLSLCDVHSSCAHQLCCKNTFTYFLCSVNAFRLPVRTTCSKTPLQSFHIFCASKIVCVWLKINFILFMLFEVIFVLLVFCKLSEPNRCFRLKMNSYVCDCFSNPCQSWISRLSYNLKWNQAIMIPFSLFCPKMYALFSSEVSLHTTHSITFYSQHWHLRSVCTVLQPDAAAHRTNQTASAAAWE
jgi:hypothetical protein